MQNDLDLVADLEAARMAGVERSGGVDSGKREDAAFERAFARHGLNLLGPGAAETAERIRTSAVRSQLTDALDHWVSIKRMIHSEGWERLLAIARSTGPDDELWWQLHDETILGDAGRVKALADSVRVEDWSAANMHLLADALIRVGEGDAATGVLRKAQQVHPGDFWLNSDLGTTLAQQGPRQQTEALTYLRIAAAFSVSPLAIWQNRSS